MQIQFTGSERTYKTEERLITSIQMKFGEDAGLLTWIAVRVPKSGKWTALFFLRHGQTHMLRTIAEFGFKVFA